MVKLIWTFLYFFINGRKKITGVIAQRPLLSLQQGSKRVGLMWNLKLFLGQWLLAAAVVSPALSLAASETSLCHLTSTLQGNSQYFWAWGRDSWAGTGLVECGGRKQSVRVVLTSFGSGSGANQDSVIELKINAFANSRLESLQGTFRTISDNNSINFVDSTNVLFASAPNVMWTVGLRSIGTIPIDFKTSIRFGQLTIELLNSGP